MNNKSGHTIYLKDMPYSKMLPSKYGKTKYYILKYLLSFTADVDREKFIDECAKLSLNFLTKIPYDNIKNTNDSILTYIKEASHICKLIHIAPILPDVLYDQISDVYYLYNKKKEIIRSHGTDILNET